MADRIDIKNLEVSWRESMQQRAVKSFGERGHAIGHVQTTLMIPLSADVLLMKIGLKDCFVFCSGCLVCWGCTPDEVELAKNAVQHVLVGPFAPKDVEEDSVDLYTDGKPALRVGQGPHTFDRVALACALAQSVYLGILEKRIDRAVAQTRSIPETMAQTGHVHHSSKGVGMMVGQMLLLRSMVNLQTDLLDTPEFFWEYDKYEAMYLSCREQLDVDQRVVVVNQRIEVLQDVYDVLESELNVRQNTRREWIIIALIALETIAMFFRLLTRLLRTQVRDPSHQIAVLPVLGPFMYAGRTAAFYLGWM